MYILKAIKPTLFIRESFHVCIKFFDKLLVFVQENFQYLLVYFIKKTTEFFMGMLQPFPWKTRRRF